jgi:NitT/TauT family transport system substrate-binding protein
MRRPLTTLTRLAAVSLPLALLATGCGGTSPAAVDGGTCKDVSVSVGNVNSASDAPMYIAAAKGYFKEEGLNIDFKSFDSAAKMVAPLGSGDLDVGGGAPSAGFYNAVARGVDLKVVADKGTMNEDFTYMPLMVRKDLIDSGQVKTIEDLRGRTIAEPAQLTATASTLSSVLEAGGMKYNDVKHTFLGFGEHLATFSNGGIDASLTTEPSATLIEKAGVAVRFDSPPKHHGDQQLAVILYSSQFAENKKAATCFMKGYVRGVRDYVDAFEDGRLGTAKADEIVKIVTDATGMKPELYRQVVPNYINPSGKLNLESLQKDYDFFLAQKAIEGKPVPLDSIVDTSFVEAAVAELGEYTEKAPSAAGKTAP